MKPVIYRRIRRRTASHDAAAARKENQQEQFFFGNTAQETFFHPAPAIQRKCADCEKEEKLQRVADNKEEEKKVMKKEEERLERSAEKKEEEKLQKKETAGLSTGVGNVSSYVNSLNGKGNSLPAKSNHFFSARMGYDFSNVKVHTDKEAADSAKAVHAKAYTVGNHVMFNEGQYNEESGEGKKLMAHELTHVVQQNNFVSPKLQRMKIGEGKPPILCGETLEKVPAEEVATVKSAITEVGKVANNPEAFPDCHSFFAENCPNGKKDSLKTTFNNVSLWKKTPSKDEVAGAAVCPEDTRIMTYTYLGYKMGSAGLASNFMHELMHNCGITGAAKHRLADKAKLYCMGSGSKTISIGAGKVDNKIVLAFSLKKFLAEWKSGRIRPYAGLSANFLLDFQKGEDSQLFAAPVIGVQTRPGLLFGGERFGGLTLGGNIGLGVGRFKDLPKGDAQKFGWQAGLLLQLHTGVEFAIPKFGTEGRVVPASFDITYSLIKPVTGEAETIHTITGGLTFSL